MEIIAHRGWWHAPDEKNTKLAFSRALEAGYGIETDIRDYNGVAVISHDPPTSQNQTLDDFLQKYRDLGATGKLALNVKADGLQRLIKDALEAHEISSYFVFDMSVPDSLHYLRSGLTLYTRRSEYELGSSLDESAAGFWLDAFLEPYVPSRLVTDALQTGKEIAIVSPELHGKPHLDAWNDWFKILESNPTRAKGVGLCTDFPDAAQEFFQAVLEH